MVCPSCGVPNAPNSPLCANCAEPLRSEAAEGPKDGRHSASTVLVRSDELGDLLEDAPQEIRDILRPPDLAQSTPSAPTSPSIQSPVPPPAVTGPRADGFERASTNLRRLVRTKKLSLVVKDANGEVAQVVGISVGRTYIGRLEGDLIIAEDPEMSPLHGRIAVGEDGTLLVRDLDSHNGTWLRFTGEAPLTDGDEFMVASQRFSYHDSWGTAAAADDETTLPMPAGWNLPHRVVASGPGRAPVHVHMLDEDLLIGREGRSPYQGDPRMARRHAEVVFTADGPILRDLSGGGLYRRLREETEVMDGDSIIMGSRTLMFRVGA